MFFGPSSGRAAQKGSGGFGILLCFAVQMLELLPYCWWLQLEAIAIAINVNQPHSVKIRYSKYSCKAFCPRQQPSPNEIKYLSAMLVGNLSGLLRAWMWPATQAVSKSRGGEFMHLCRVNFAPADHTTVGSIENQCAVSRIELTKREKLHLCDG
jgi:hypothetical protein